ncbi:MAG: sigma-54-dependent Fis family transcriptional regulator [Alphaproteobacteria bacterium]|nr:sigma-54-dependent Fis family transcriptional regulator [Alphaproteobacteria bacterium]
MATDILIVDDEDDIRLLIADILRDEGYEVRGASNADAALDEIARRRPSLVLLDIWLEGSRLDGMQILQHLHREDADVPVVMISGHGTIELAVQAIREGAWEFIEKPFKTDRLRLVVRRAVEAARLRRENQELLLRTGDIAEVVGESAAIVQVRQAIERVAPTGSRVMISGPAGAGKEVAARLLHRRSRRSDGPFVVVNCATMSPECVEIALFGTEGDGANGAGSPRSIGLFERAHGGTLLLDEIADMPAATQGKIVRVLQEQTFERVGGATRVRVDVRVIATTTRDLKAEITAGRFREDLFYRLSVVPIEVPPLTRRRDDIPLLCDHFMTRSAAISGLSERRLSTDAIAALQAYDWPGNVRQLRNLIDWLLIMAPGDADTLIGVDMLPPEVSGDSPPILRRDGNVELLGLNLRAAREEFERQYLAAQVMRFGGNISRTAEFVGMERSALHRKIKLLGVSSEAAGLRRRLGDGAEGIDEAQEPL